MAAVLDTSRYFIELAKGQSDAITAQMHALDSFGYPVVTACAGPEVLPAVAIAAVGCTQPKCGLMESTPDDEAVALLLAPAAVGRFEYDPEEPTIDVEGGTATDQSETSGSGAEHGHWFF